MNAWLNLHPWTNQVTVEMYKGEPVLLEHVSTGVVGVYVYRRDCWTVLGTIAEDLFGGWITSKNDEYHDTRDKALAHILREA